MITKEEFEAAQAQRAAAEKTINAYCKQKSDEFKERWRQFTEEKKYFTDDELTYAAVARCGKCKAGMAHPKGCDPWHQWTCSDVLKGVGEDNGHEALPFSFYEVKSENQPSAQGATTRPQPTAA